MFNEVQKEFDSSVRRLAENSLLKKLKKQGIKEVIYQMNSLKSF